MLDIKIPDSPTSPSLISLHGLCGRKSPCFLSVRSSSFLHTCTSCPFPTQYYSRQQTNKNKTKQTTTTNFHRVCINSEMQFRSTSCAPSVSFAFNMTSFFFLFRNSSFVSIFFQTSFHGLIWQFHTVQSIKIDSVSSNGFRRCFFVFCLIMLSAFGMLSCRRVEA